jgi:hypothetical protein
VALSPDAAACIHPRHTSVFILVVVCTTERCRIGSRHHLLDVTLELVDGAGDRRDFFGGQIQLHHIQNRFSTSLLGTKFIELHSSKQQTGYHPLFSPIPASRRKQWHGMTPQPPRTKHPKRNKKGSTGFNEQGQPELRAGVARAKGTFAARVITGAMLHHRWRQCF